MAKKKIKEIKKNLGRVILPPNKVEKDKKKYDRKIKHKKNEESE